MNATGRRRQHVAICLLNFLLLAAFLTCADAQETGAPVLRVTSCLVQVSVIVQDRHGRPVRGMTRADFILTDNGRPQDIAVFLTENAEPSTADAAFAQAKGSLVVKNRSLASAGSSLPVTVILFDALNMPALDDFQHGKRDLVKFLRTLRPGDPVALYSLNGPTVQVIHDFTDDSSSLMQAAQHLSGTRLSNNSPIGPTSATAAANQSAPASRSAVQGQGRFDQMNKWLHEASRADEAARLRMRTEWTLAALEAIAHHLAGVPGRKNLVWISGAFPITIGLDMKSLQSASSNGVNQELFNFSDRAQRIGRLFSEAQIAIYPIDPAGLVGADPIYSASIKGEEANAQIQESKSMMVTASEIAEPGFESMQLLARQTGGLAFFNANDLAASIQRVMNDARVTYTLGFYPPEGVWEGGYHELRVKVKREGAVVRARQGYFASAPLFEPELREREPMRDEALRLAVASPLEGEAIGIKVNVQSNPLDWYGQFLVLTTDPNDLRFVEQDGRIRSEVDFVFAQLASNGRLVTAEKKTVQYALLPDSYQRALAQGLFFEEPITVDPRTAHVRVVVRDASTGAVGSVSIPVRRE